MTEVQSRDQPVSSFLGEVKPIPLTPEVEARLLKPKRMQDSYVELYLPFTEDPELLEKYIATSGLIRIGKIVEDLDTLAGNSECLSNNLPKLVVDNYLPKLVANVYRTPGL